MWVLFLRNFAYARFGENKILTNWRDHSVYTDIGISRPCHEFSTTQICVLTLFAKIKFSRKYPNLKYEENWGSLSYFKEFSHSGFAQA